MPVRIAIESEADPGVVARAIEPGELRLGGQGKRRAGKSRFQGEVVGSPAKSSKNAKPVMRNFSFTVRVTFDENMGPSIDSVPVCVRE
jgi:hypothetical protein